MRCYLGGVQFVSRFVVKRHIYLHVKAPILRVDRQFTTGLAAAVKEFNWGSNKKHRAVKLHFPTDMTDPKIEEVLAPLRANVKQQVFIPYGY